MSNLNIDHLNRCKDVCLRMIVDRGYNNPIIIQHNNYIIIHGSINEKKKYLYFLSLIHDKENDYKFINDAFGSNIFDSKVLKFTTDNTTILNNFKIIFVLNDGLEFPKRHDLELKRDKTHTYFSMNRLIVNPIKHYLQPKYVLHRENSVKYKEIMEIYRAKPINFTKFCYDDPVVKYYDGQVNDIFEIVYKSGDVQYRIVQNKNINLYQDNK